MRVQALSTDYLQAQGMFRNLGVDFKGDRFQGAKNGKIPYKQLMDYVEQYFLNATCCPITQEGDGIRANASSNVVYTTHSPIYIQRPGHSMTIIGLEVRNNGSRNLLVFDPAYVPSKALMSEVPADLKGQSACRLLKPYRRGKRQLKRYNAFEILTLRSIDLTAS